MVADDSAHIPFVENGQTDPGETPIDVLTLTYEGDPLPHDAPTPTGEYAAQEQEGEFPTERCTETIHRRFGGACIHCCPACNYDQHVCMYCGQSLRHDGREWQTRLDAPHIVNPDHRAHCPELTRAAHPAFAQPTTEE